MENIKVCVERLIKIEVITGNGTKENPIRNIIQYWDLNGNLLFTLDGYKLSNLSASSETNS